MVYKITFFKLDVSSTDWKLLFNSFFEVTSSVKVKVIRNGIKVDFYIESDKKLDALNSKLYPFYLTDEIPSKELEGLEIEGTTRRMMPFFIDKDLFETLERRSIDGHEIAKIEFKVGKYNLFKTLPGLKIVYRNNEKYINVNGALGIHLYMFLAFNLTTSINSEITKVKPVLASSNLNLELFDEGILEAKCLNGRKFAVDSYDFGRHTLIIGQSGSGKSYLIKLLIENLYKKFPNEYAVVLVDPHASLDRLVTGIERRKSINFKDLSTNLFINVGQSTLSTELTMDLFSTVMNIRENQNLARVCKYALNALFSINKMNLANLKKLLTDTLFRKELLKGVADQNVLQFFETEYQQIYTSQYAIAVLPIINLISELEFINNVPATTELVNEIQNNFLVSIPISQTELGTNVTKIIGGAIIQQVFTILQGGLVNKKVLLIIDEVSVVQTPSLVHILSEARKFGLTLVLAQQYLMQVSGEILQSIFANVVNYFCFKLARDDAEVVARNLNCEIDEYFLKNKNDPREMQELGVKLLTDLNPQEVITRIMANSNYYSPFKAKTVKVNLNQ